MKYFDYVFDLSEDRIILDEEINVDKIGWKGGDIFKLVNIDGQTQLIKIDRLEKFTRGID